MDGKDLGAMPFHGKPDVVSEIGNHYAVGCDGITLRQHFAGLAMQGILSGDSSDVLDNGAFATYCVNLADALLAELSKEQP